MCWVLNCFCTAAGLKSFLTMSPILLFTPMILPPLLHPADIWLCLETFLIVKTGRSGMLLVSSGSRSGMLLNILQSVGQPLPCHTHSQQRAIWPRGQWC